ncbi:BRCA2 and CDKN1A-interacting protein isoform X4 [Equus przewalskii]|uniref:BRCA2 and CDKN1A-interacting protein isoform X4 n=1 Tax=Equus przewalskii TaxID=9798 RepID=A0ABM4KCG1_EQUPR|nr:BRCA2 and CDKN1A-interacting protein isoform X4 [Equus caballus]
MASRPKRRAVCGGASVPREQAEEEDEVEDEDEDDEDSEEEEDEDEIVDELFLKAPVNTAELTDLLIQQNHIGSVIKGTQCAEQIKELILSFCEKNCEKSMVEQLDKLLNDTTKPVGFLLSERFINVPPQIALPMHQQLQKELAEAHKTNKPCGKCCFYLLISKTFVEAGKHSKKKQSNQEKVELMFANAEEEFFYEKAILKFSYSVQEESDTCLGGRWSFDDVPMKPLRTVMLIPGDKMNEIMDKLKEHLSI